MAPPTAASIMYKIIYINYYVSNKKQYPQNCRYCKKSRQPNFQKKPLNKIWAPPRLKFPELSGIPSSHRVDPVPKNLLFSEDGPDGYFSLVPFR